MRGWQTVRRDMGVHIVPVNDLVPHHYSTTCWCRPTIEIEGRIDIVSHNAMDGREQETPHS